MKLHFLGANKQVTGSSYLLEAAGLRILIDCGLFQERKFQKRNWEPPPYDPAAIDHVLLTHAHLDHVGLIPRLVANGYPGRVTTVEPSVELGRIVMLDAGRIQQEDAAYKKRRHNKEGRTGKHGNAPLYTEDQARTAAKRLKGVKYNEPVKLSDDVSATFHEAGHILGSAFVVVTARENGVTKSVAFSGDLGQWQRPLINGPTAPGPVDHLVMESTYGDRDHKASGPVRDQLADIINDTAARGGNIVVPTFAIERAQELIYLLGGLIHEGRVPKLPVYLDSPMAVDVTDVFHRHCDYLKEEHRCDAERVVAALRYPGLRLVRRTRESMAINRARGTSIILAGSGMCTGGRIKHHLRANLGRPESTILFVGYQAEGTLGREIVQGKDPVRIHGRQWPVRADIAQIHGFSAHGDRDDLLRWLTELKQPPAHLFLTHGDEQAANSLATRIQKQLKWPAKVPDYLDAIDLG